ncbi:MAG: hypothetical protein HY721_23545 [Planctomycetes bacterium]|nr:hypothetical protein [Planctomycetota bacterium]
MSVALGVLAWRGSVNGQSRTYTLDPDFDEGVLFNVNHDAPNHDQLQLGRQVTTFPVMWIANAGEDTVSRWDTDNNKEVARYNTWFGPPAAHGAFAGPAPSRTAVDLDGNCYVANRHFDGRPATVLKILLDSFIDRNGNGMEDTSFDADSSGTIQPSEMLPMADTNGDGMIQQSEIRDERVAWATHVGPANGLGRCVAIDGSGDIWVGLFNSRQFWKLRGSDGAILGGPFPAGSSPYGALVDANGILWAATLGNDLIEFNTNTSTLVALRNHAAFGSNYGVALGRDAGGNTIVYLGSFGGSRSFIRYNSGTGVFDAPAAGTQYQGLGISTDGAGDIYSGVRGGSAGAGLGVGSLVRYRPDGSRVWASSAQVGGDNRGVPIDANGDVWFVHLDQSRLSKFRGTDGAHLGVFPTGRFPYTYSDATGLGLRSSFPQGTWTVVHDGGSPGILWTSIAWNQEPQGFEPQPGAITVEARAADTAGDLAAAPFSPVTNGGALALTGQLIEVRATLRPAGDQSPVLSDLTINGRPPNEPPDCSGAALSASGCWPPNHKFTVVTVVGVTDPNGDPVAITVTGITQDEVVKGPGRGSGSTCPDGAFVDTDGDLVPDAAGLRCERDGTGNGRVYSVQFSASDGKGGECTGSAMLCVVHDQRPGAACVDDGQTYDSTVCPAGGAGGTAAGRVPVLSLGEIESLTPAPLFLRGDVNWDESLDISDGISILLALFSAASEPDCYDAADVNDDDDVDVSDAIALFGFLYLGDFSPPPPVEQVGSDPTTGSLGCE